MRAQWKFGVEESGKLRERANTLSEPHDVLRFELAPPLITSMTKYCLLIYKCKCSGQTTFSSHTSDTPFKKIHS